MPGFAPRPTLLASFKRIHEARVGQRGGVVLIAGIEYLGELILGAVSPEMDANTGRPVLVQRGTFNVSKDLLPTPPKRGSVLKTGPDDFEIESCGSAPNAAAWNIKFNRLAPK